MLISMNWISDFVDLSGLDIEALIKRFTLSTAEVEEIYHKGEDVQGVVAGKILTVENHPNSKKLHLLTVDAGDKVYDVVCGAPNVRVGMIVPFAKEGGKAGGMDIRKATIAGYDSYGMCCSESELGISDDHSGLWELPEDTVVGTDIKQLYPIDDIVFEVDNKSLTNRPDLWGHYGIAREFAVLANSGSKKDRRLRPLKLHDTAQYDALPEVDINVIDTEHCYRYSSIKVENVTERRSPAYMRIRLFYCGMRAINLLADLTNYLMLEMGQPMHAFDLRKVDKVEVKRFSEPFTFETLDKTERTIDEDMLMITSGGQPVAIAGIMGGYDSEIADDTTSLLIESANFDGVSVRKSTVRLGLRTDASMRYEKMLDPELTVPAIGRYLELLYSICPNAKVISSLSDSYVKRYPTIKLDFDTAYVERYTGIKMSKKDIAATLTALGFDFTSEGKKMSVIVPSWRSTKDVTIKADIIEEISRIYGYDNFEIKTTLSALAPVLSSPGRVADRAVKDILADRFSLNEVHSYIWNDAKKLKELGLEVEDNVRLVNSINPDQVVLRRSIIPNLLVFLNENKLFSDDFGMFEIARVANGLTAEGKCNERKRLGIVLYSRTMTEKQLYLKLKDMILFIMSNVKNIVPTLAHTDEITHMWQHPVNNSMVTADGVKLGGFYTLTPAIAEKLDKKAAIVCAELDMDDLAALSSQDLSFDEPSKFPGVDFDLSLIAERGKTYGDIMDIVKGYDCPILKGRSLVDIYESKELGDKRVITIRLTFSSPERTLTGEEVTEHSNCIIKLLDNAGFKLR